MTRTSARLTRPTPKETTKTAMMVGVARSSARSAQPLVAEGGTSQSMAGSSNPYGEWPCATAEAKIAVAYRHTTAITPSLARGTEANYVARGRVVAPPTWVRGGLRPRASLPAGCSPTSARGLVGGVLQVDPQQQGDTRS